MADDKLNQISTNKFEPREMGMIVDQMIAMSQMHRRNFERRWYDNNFFYDGHHFRYQSRQTGKIVDLSSNANLWTPTRAIPKASRQIQGIANVLISNDPVPAVYPERVDRFFFPEGPEGNQIYQAALKQAQDIAKKVGSWITSEFKQQDFLEKLAFMVILTAKHGVSYMKIWPDDSEEKIRMAVRDAFDIYTTGDMTELEDCPYIVETQKTLISTIKSNPKFDKDALSRISPDNRYASSEIKEAYMSSRYGKEFTSDSAATLIQKEAFIKERLNDLNMDRIRSQKNGGEILQATKPGQIVMRHTFSAGGVTLMDEYLKSNKYPYLDYRMEPGPIYQTPLIERFIPQNKSLDAVVSRIERYTHTMAVGIYQKRSGEQFHISNQAGGQIIEYDQRPLEQMQVASMPPFVFQFANMLGSFIEEQGVTTSALGKLPAGVKANAAIESLKESEMTSLAIPIKKLKGLVRRVSQRMLDIGDDYFINPQTVSYMEKGQPQYFDIIGNSALKKRQELNIAPPQQNLVPIKKDYFVEIEIEAGMGFTRQGQRETMMALMRDFLIPLVEKQLLPPDVVKQMAEQVLKTYQYGQTAEFMQTVNEQQNANMTDDQITAMKIALAQVMGDLIKNKVLPDQDTRIMETKVATAEAIKDTGLKQKPQEEDKPNMSIPYKDLPPEGKVQMAQEAGINITVQDVIASEQRAADIATAQTHAANVSKAVTTPKPVVNKTNK